jgi:hypothetical protein
MIRFSKTVLEEGPGRLRLLDDTGIVLLEVEGHEIDDAIRGGFLDPRSLHYSMFEFWRIRQESRAQTVVGDVDSGRTVDLFLESLDFRRPEGEEPRAA